MIRYIRGTQILVCGFVLCFFLSINAKCHTNSIIEGLVNNMISIKGGTFTMGATEEQGSMAEKDELPVHEVTLSDFSMGRYEVTQEEWEAVMGNNPSLFKGTRKAVEQVSWNDCQEFIGKLNAATGKKFRLPTEAEWEYAAKGGIYRRGCKYSGSNGIDEVACYEGNCNEVIPEVGMKAPNELGLFDMSGGVWEWCNDWYDEYPKEAQTNPQGPPSASGRVYRGGSWTSSDVYCRVPCRYCGSPIEKRKNLGLRLVLSE